MAFFEFPHTRTYDSDLGWLISQVSSYDDTIAALDQWIEENTPRIEDLEKCCEALNSGNLPPGVAAGIETWMRRNAARLLTDAVKNVWFGLTLDGYFVAYIPDSWSDIIFNTTGYDINLLLQPDYGHLVLSY